MPPDQTIELSGQAGERHVFSTVSAQRGEVQTVDLKPTFIALGLPPSAFKPEFRGATGTKIFDAAVGGGMLYPGIVWIFMGEDYIRLNLRTNELSGPAITRANWGQGQWPATFRSGVDAAVTFTNAPEFMWFFKGPNYIRYNLATDKLEGGPSPFLPNWVAWPESFSGGVDAAIEGRGAYEGMAWFFKGSEYIRYNNLSNMVDSGPTPIASMWNGWPESFTKVDCAISGVGSETEIIYLFRGDQFIAYDLVANVVLGPPKPIGTKWPKLSAFMRHPQFFLVEAIQLKTYYGDISAGPPQSATHGLDPNSDQTYTLIVTRTQTDSISDTMTVLESQDETLIDNVNTSMHDEAANSRSSEQYDYKFDSSFEGDLSYTGLGGEVNASLSFQGSSNDLREAASKASKNAIQKQVSKTEQNRRQSTRAVTGTHTSTSQLESTFTRTVRNPTNKPINIGVFQLFQEYLVLVVLSDIKLAFSNGGQPEIAPLSRLDVLIDKYVADPSQAESIKKALVAEVQQVLDYRRKPVNVVKEVGGGRVEFDTELKSTFNLTNTDGTTRREMVVPGVLLGHHAFKQLTEAALITEMDIG